MAVLGFDLTPLRQGITDTLGQVRDDPFGALNATAQQQTPDYSTYIQGLGAPGATLNQSLATFGAPALGGTTSGTIQAQPTGDVTNGLAGLIGAAQNFAQASAFAAQQKAQQQQNSRPVALPGSQPAAGGTGWNAAPSATDNAGLTADKINQWISTTRPNSPMNGLGQFILDQANAANVSVPEMLGIFLKESELGTTAGPAWNVAGVGGQGNFRGYPDVQAAVADAIRNLGSPLYQGKSLQDHIGYWYVGTDYQQKGGLQATDSTGGANGTVGDYLNMVSQVYQGLGVPLGGGGGGGGGNGKFEAGNLQGGADPQGAIAKAQQWLGQAYTNEGIRTTGNPADGFDCSSLVGWAYNLPRDQWTAQSEYDHTQRLDQSQLQPGDLVFFTNTYDAGTPVTHVGIYVGTDQQGHPLMLNDQDNGVQYADLSNAYWQYHYYGAGRLPQGAPSNYA